MRLSRLVGLVVLALGPLIAPYAAGGQTPGHIYRVGIILLGGPYHVLVDGLRQGLRELGLEEGKHFVLPGVLMSWEQTGGSALHFPHQAGHDCV